jgi:hypothetical protein
MIKKHRNKNEYYLAGGGLWVRNFTKKNILPIDINSLIPDHDMKLMLHNETENRFKMLQRIDTESFSHPKIAIVGDGYGFEQGQSLLERLPPDVTVIGVNETLRRWANNQKMHYYVVNDPYDTCMHLLPKNQRVWPRCIASTRTNPDFISRFNGIVYEYSPVTDKNYSGLSSEAEYFVDDYRNAACAAVGLAYKFNVNKLLLFWCCDVFDHERAGAEKLPNNAWIYPQQKTAHQLVDGNLYWLRTREIKVGHHSKGPEYKNAAYISEGDLARFFAE